MPVFKWSKTAVNNATANSTINWAEGMAPSAVNNSSRAEMAAVAKWRDDISGTLTTSGSSTVYTLTTNSAFDSLANMSGAMITFIPHTTSGASPTLNVDSLGAKQIRSATGTNVATGALIAGTPYTVTYVHASTEFILIGYTETFANVTATGTLAVTGASTFTGAATFNGGGALGTGTYTGAATFSGALTFSARCSFTSTDSMAMAKGTTAQRNGAPAAGDVRYNSTLAGLEYWNGAVWIVLGQAPTVQRFTSGTSQTYTPSTGVVRIRVRMCGGGGGGAAAQTNNGSTGGTSSFGSWTCIGGNGGAGNGGGAGGTGGASGTGQLVVRFDGGGGGPGAPFLGGVNGFQGIGGSSAFGGAARGLAGIVAGNAGAVNSGGGGSGGSDNAGHGGGGGGAGEYVEFWVNGPGATTYTVGTGGNGGTAGTQAGGNGAAGMIIIEEFYA